MLARFDGRKEISPDVWEYSLLPERPLDYVPGQYVDVQLLRDFADRRGRGRVFTLTSLPNDPALVFVLKFPQPGSPYKRELQTLKPGEELRIGDAMGDVVLPKNPATPLIFIAGGLGIASFVSSLRWLQANKETRNIQLFYGRRTPEDNPYGDLIDSFPFTEKHIAISPERLAASAILNATTPESLVYLSGSQPFVESLRAELMHGGVDHERLIFDYYDGYVSL